jgi:hypothetical protein
MENRFKSNFRAVSNSDIIKRFTETLDDASYEDIRAIVESPFKALKEDLRNDKLYVHRFENWGTYYCSIDRAKTMLKSIERNVASGSITEERYNELKIMLNDFIKRKSEES